MASENEAYSAEQEITEFFAQTSTARQACDDRAKELTGADRITLPPIQGACSYTVFAGPKPDVVVQFRFKSLAISLTTIGEDEGDREALYIYVMSRMKGMTWLDFTLAYVFPKNTVENCANRLTLVTDVARFFALSWKSPQILSRSESKNLQQTYETELRLLLSTLPERFHLLIHRCLDALPSIMALPMVLTHKDFYEANLLVDPSTCHLVGIVDWGDATIEPFGVTLNSVQLLMAKIDLRSGCIRHNDFDILYDTFWKTLRDEVDWSGEVFHTVQSAMALGHLLEQGFTRRLGRAPKPIPICDDEQGAYNMRMLDGFLINTSTKMIR